MGEAGSGSPYHREPCNFLEPASAGRERLGAQFPTTPQHKVVNSGEGGPQPAAAHTIAGASPVDPPPPPPPPPHPHPPQEVQNVEEVRTTFGPSLAPKVPENFFQLTVGGKISFFPLYLPLYVSSQCSEFCGEFKYVFKT